MIYVCSDVHGHGDRFYKLLKEINLKDSDILYILGDLIDRNENSMELLKYVMSQKNIKLLMGNHEEFMFSYLFNLNKIGRLNEKHKFPNDIWFDENNGGLETLKDFVKESAEEKRNILKFLYHIPLVCILDIDGTKFHLSHTGTLPNILEKNIWKLSDVNIKQKQIITWGTPFREDIYLPPSYYSDKCLTYSPAYALCAKRWGILYV